MAPDSGRWIKIPQTGRAVIGDDVEIGANTTIDRGDLDDTVIEDGVKLDNQAAVLPIEASSPIVQLASITTRSPAVPRVDMTAGSHRG